MYCFTDWLAVGSVIITWPVTSACGIVIPFYRWQRWLGYLFIIFSDCFSHIPHLKEAMQRNCNRTCIYLFTNCSKTKILNVCHLDSFIHRVKWTIWGPVGRPECSNTERRGLWRLTVALRKGKCTQLQRFCLVLSSKGIIGFTYSNFTPVR